MEYDKTKFHTLNLNCVAVFWASESNGLGTLNFICGMCESNYGVAVILLYLSEIEEWGTVIGVAVVIRLERRRQSNDNARRSRRRCSDERATVGAYGGTIVVRMAVSVLLILLKTTATTERNQDLG